jgi:hypothetical protein
MKNAVFWDIITQFVPHKQTNSLAFSPQANYTDWTTATCRRNLVSTFVGRGMSRGQRGGSTTVVNLSFLDLLLTSQQTYYFTATDHSQLMLCEI